MSSVINFCNKALFIEHGKVVDLGPSSRIAEKYFLANNTAISDEKVNPASEDYNIQAVDIYDDSGKKVDLLHPNRMYTLSIKLNFKKRPPKKFGIGFAIKNGSTAVAGYNSYMDSKTNFEDAGRHEIRYTFKNKLKNGQYSISVGVHEDIIEQNKYSLKQVNTVDRIKSFTVSGWNPPGTLVDLDAITEIISRKDTQE
jgi:ABC-type multidrug transport system ATPase subunit